LVLPPLLKGQKGQTYDLAGQTVGPLDLRDCQDVTFIGGTFTGAVEVAGCSGVRFVKPRSAGDGSFNAFSFRRSHDCELTGATVIRPRCGVKIIECQDVRVLGSSFLGLGIDGVNITASQDVLIRGNAFVGSLLEDDHHPDAVQINSTPIGKPASARIVVSGNRAYGDMQGFCAHGSAVPHEDVTFAENEADLSRAWGVRLNDGSGTVRGNKIRTLPGSRYQARIGVCEGVLRVGNVQGEGAGKRAVID
jgi:hypothetical protein